MIKLTRAISFIFLLIVTLKTPAALTLYEGSGPVEGSGWFIYGQVPLPEEMILPVLEKEGIPSSLLSLLPSSLMGPLAEGVGTSTLTTDLGDGEKGYAGYANYNYNIPLEAIKEALLSGKVNQVTTAAFTGSFEPVNADFPTLDCDAGFDLTFNVAITEETSQDNRAGFSLIAICSDGKQGIELGFKKGSSSKKKSQCTSDRIFSQSSKFKEDQNTCDTVGDQLVLSTLTEYVLEVRQNNYTLFANLSGEKTEILTGKLQKYNFNPLKSSPKLPFNPYQAPNFLFFGDDTDKGSATFTLGNISIDGSFAQGQELGQGLAFDAEGNPVETTTEFGGGISLAGEAPQTEIEQNLSDKVTVVGEIETDSEHVGKVAHMVVYAAYSFSCFATGDDEEFYMLDNEGRILVWDQKPASLVGFREDVILGPEQFMKMYDGEFLATGCLRISFGYMLQEEGTLVINGNTMNIKINK